MSRNHREKRRGTTVRKDLRSMMKCFCSGEQLVTADEMVPRGGGSGSSTDRFYSAPSARSSRNSRSGDRTSQKPDPSNIEEAELSLQKRGSLNNEEARALLGRIEYQKRNFEAALHVFEGIDVSAITPKVKFSLARHGDQLRRKSHDYMKSPLSIQAVSLLLEALFLKAKSLQHLESFRGIFRLLAIYLVATYIFILIVAEAAESCKVIVDIVESSLPEGLPKNFAADCKLQEIVSKAVELLPELWKHADNSHETIMSYRRALLHRWNLDVQTTARIQREFAIFLLYSGGEASPPNLRFQMDSSFVPRNNLEEAILLFMILLRQISLKKIEWDPSILDHLSFALSVSGDLLALANHIEELPPGIISRKEMFYNLALCYYNEGEEVVALNLLKKLLHNSEDPNFVPGLLVASKICGTTPQLAAEGIDYARRALKSMDGGCHLLESTANLLLGISLSSCSRSAFADSERVSKQSESLKVLECAAKITNMECTDILYHLSLENAEQRKLDRALHYAKKSLKRETGSSIKGWLLLARIFSAQKCYSDAENVITAALDQTSKWDQGELLRTKAKIQVKRGQMKNAIQTYTQILAVLQVQTKTFGTGKKIQKVCESDLRRLELEVWHDLASLYISLSRLRDAEVCLLKSKAIQPYSAPRCHIVGTLYEKKGLLKEALRAFVTALSIDPVHVASLVSTAIVLRKVGGTSNEVLRSFLMGALRIDRMNVTAWYNLGLVHKDEGLLPSSLMEAADCFEAATFLDETEPVEPFQMR
ncbi:Protein NPGR2 [Linum perenne]